MPSVGLIVMAGVVGAALIGMLVALKHRRWGVLLAVPISVVAGALLLPLMAMEHSPEGERPEAVAVDLPAVPGMPDVPGVPGVPGMRFVNAEVATDAELAAIAGAAPEIDLSDSEVEESLAPNKSRPEWIDGVEMENHLVLSTDPFATVDAAKEAARQQLIAAIGDRLQVDTRSLGEDPAAAAAEIVKRFVEQQHLEKREVSVGEVYLMHTLVKFDKADVDWIAEKADAWHRLARQRTGVRAVTAVGGGVLAVVALLHGVLRSGGRNAKP